MTIAVVGGERMSKLINKDDALKAFEEFLADDEPSDSKFKTDMIAVTMTGVRQILENLPSVDAVVLGEEYPTSDYEVVIRMSTDKGKNFFIRRAEI